MRQIVFLGANLLGDCLCTTPTVRAFRKKHPDAYITYVAQNEDHCRVLEGNPDIDRVIYSDELVADGPQIVNDSWLRQLAIDFDESSILFRFDIHALHRSHPDVFKDHLCQGFARLHDISIDSVRPVIAIDAAQRAAARSQMRGRTIVLGMHTTSPVIGRDGEFARKEWVFERWLQLARQLHACGEFDVLAVGARSDAQVDSRCFRNLYGLPIKVVAALLAEAACVVTVESGLSHLCHAVDAPMVLIFSRDVPLAWARPDEATRCRVIYDDTRLISCERVIAAVKSVLAMSRPPCNGDV